MVLTLVLSAGAQALPRAPSLNQADSPVKIRVRLDEASAQARIRGFDLDLQAGGESRQARRLASDRTTEWELHCQNGRVRAQRIFPAQGAVSVELQEPVTIRTPAGFLRFKGKPYREKLRVFSKGSLCEVVNEVDLEKYLEGLVNAEFSSRWSLEAVAAQVVAARTYALFQIRQAKGGAGHYDVDATVRDQVYDGSIREDFRASKSVTRTRGLVLTVGSGEAIAPLKAYYHSTCGGSTELPEHVWGSANPGFKHTVRCPYCGVSPSYRWSSELGLGEISASLLRGARADGAPQGWPADYAGLFRGPKLAFVKVKETDQAGRAQKITLQFGGAGGPQPSLTLSAARFRNWMGAAKLKSTLFQIEESEGRVRFIGRGNGHGVGMCQWGAKVMGEKGKTMAAILNFYYPDAVLRKLW